MKKLSKEKQIHLALVCIATIGVITAMIMFLIQPKYAEIKSINHKSETTQDDINRQKRVIATGGAVARELAEATNRLDAIEKSMANGDLYSWIVTSIRQFNVPSYKVNLNQFSTPDQAEMRLFPNFPYKQVSFNINGTAYFSDLGKFVADLENQFPYMRVQNITLDPISASTPQDREKIFFRMEIVHLVKPTPTLVASR